MKNFFIKIWRILNNRRLEAATLVSGAVVMVFEILGSRLLAPYLGSSLITWTSIIGVILASLAIGYAWGGRLADRRVSQHALAVVLWLAGGCLLLALLAARPVLSWLSAASWPLGWRAVTAAVLLLAPASVALGMVTPYAARLRIDNVAASGRVIGGLSAWSTVGSLLGTFGAGFWLVPTFGTMKILAGLAAAVWLAAFWLTIAKRPRIRQWLTLLGAFILVFGVYENWGRAPAGLVDSDTMESRVWIYDTVEQKSHRPVRLLRLDSGFSSARFLDGDDLIFDYTKYYDLAGYFNPGFNRVLMIGGAAYSYPQFFLKKWPRAELTVAEIDPRVTDLARRYFKLESDPRLIIKQADGRVFLNQNTEIYDAILVDAFSASYSLPWQLSTLEAARREYDSLAADGVVIINLVASLSGAGSLLTDSLSATYARVFPQVFLLPVNAPQNETVTQNIMLVALKSKVRPDWRPADPLVAEQLSHRYSGAASKARVLTDDWAPTDYFASRLKL